jgi:hypothetical protein
MKVAYLDIETSYVGRYTDNRLFKDFGNHQITVIGIRILDGARDSFIQLVGKDVTLQNLTQALAGVERIVTYNGRSIPDHVKGYIGFDFPVIAAQLGVVLDKEFQHLDLCPLCWKANLWGGLKAVEQMLGLKRQLPGKDGKWENRPSVSARRPAGLQPRRRLHAPPGGRSAGKTRRLTAETILLPFSRGAYPAASPRTVGRSLTLPGAYYRLSLGTDLSFEGDV